MTRPTRSRRLAISTLLPLGVPPFTNPRTWTSIAVGAAATAAVLELPEPMDDRTEAEIAEALCLLAEAGVAPLGHIGMNFGTRPTTEVLDAIQRWARLPAVGIFLDQAPAGPYQVPSVDRIAHTAQDLGLTTIVLNPGMPVDSAYREINATICTFAGGWRAYQSWDGEGAQPGDGHLVYGVPAAQQDTARGLVAARGAGLALVSDGWWPYACPVCAR